jgi:presenilin-like A22 family membrane protease
LTIAGCPSAGSLSQSIHSASGLFEYLGGLIGLLLLAAAFWSESRWRGSAVLSAVAATLVGIGFLGMLQPSQQESRGLYQRIADGAIFAWIARTSLVLRRGVRAVGTAPRVARDA